MAQGSHLKSVGAFGDGPAVRLLPTHRVVHAILNVLYNRGLRVSPQTFGDPLRDRYVQSKGHCVEALYAVLADRGFFPASDLASLCHCQSHYVGHPTRHIPGIEMNMGALGHGLPICIGMALAGKMDALPYRVFTLLGDGELAEGSDWEAALAAAHYRLDIDQPALPPQRTNSS